MQKEYDKITRRIFLIMCSMILLVVTINTLTLISAQENDFAYNHLDFGNTVVDGLNYSINVNNSNFLEGHLASYFYPYSNPLGFITELLGNSIWCQLTGCTMSGNINLGQNNITGNYSFFNSVNSTNITANKFFGDGSQLTNIPQTDTSNKLNHTGTTRSLNWENDVLVMRFE